MAGEAPAPSAITSNLDLLPGSGIRTDLAHWALARTSNGFRLAVAAAASADVDFSLFEGDTVTSPASILLLGPLSPRNARAVRRHLPWLAPEPVGLHASVGMGDRLGLATPGHVLALRAAGSSLTPVFAQQSIREMTRTGRSPQDVLDAATWGAFETGWRGGMGADADHLKSIADLDVCLEAGFTWFTIDPGDHVSPEADNAVPAAVRAAYEDLPWRDLEDSPAGLVRRYAGAVLDVEGHPITFDEETVLRAAVKYARAVAHVAALHRHLASRLAPRRFDLEVSVDETETPTSAAEHVFVAREMKRLGVRWTSLAPRFVGRFEKGVDYIGDLQSFERDVAVHAAIARFCGPYKLSLHSGSDKFSIYPAVARHTAGLVHLKTAGTSYLEALRAVALVDPSLFRDIYAFALARYDEDRASYHVSAVAGRAPAPGDLADGDLASVLDHFDARQVLHVTFGSVLTVADEGTGRRFQPRFMALLRSRPEVYAACLRDHFARHLAPFSRPA